MKSDATPVQLKYWSRVELFRGSTKIARRIECWAMNADEAKELMEATIRAVWPGWSIGFIVEPQRGQS